MKKIILMVAIVVGVGLCWGESSKKADQQGVDVKSGQSKVKSQDTSQDVNWAVREKAISTLINNLGLEDKKLVKESKEKLKVAGNESLDVLHKSAKTKNRKLRLEIISTYLEIILEQQRNPQEDKFVMDSMNDEYYMTRIIVLGILANKGHKNLAEVINKKIAEPSEDDGRIFTEITSEMRIKLNKEWKMWNPAMLEEGYLISMGKKINPKLENIISNENESIILRKRLLHVYRDINKKKGNKYLVKVLEETQNMEIKREILSDVNSDWNKNDTLLIEELKRILSKEKNIEIKESYNLIINDLMKK